jgi:hypothetical protein
MKSALVILGWIITTAGLYAGLVLLDFYWNVPAWHPVGDSIGWFLVAWLGAMLVPYWHLSRASVNRAARIFSFLICIGLALLALHVLPGEALKSGMFARPAASPWWYRGGLAIILGSPGLFWFAGWLRRRRLSEPKDGTAPTDTTDGAATR